MNSNTCTQTVTVTDNVDPTITCAADVVVEGCDAENVTLNTPTTNDNCGVTSVTNDAPATFPLGDTIVTWTVTDTSGNTATCEQTVTVQDTTDPMIACPADITTDTDSGMDTAVVNYTAPVGTDNCTATTTQTAGLPSGSTFPIGITTNTFTVTDGSGNTTSCSFTVTVNDADAPDITCPCRCKCVYRYNRMSSFFSNTRNSNINRCFGNYNKRCTSNIPSGRYYRDLDSNRHCWMNSNTCTQISDRDRQRGSNHYLCSGCCRRRM